MESTRYYISVKKEKQKPASEVGYSWMTKYVDDLTILEIIPRNSPSYLKCIVDDIQCFSHCNNMRLNQAKACFKRRATAVPNSNEIGSAVARR